MPLTIGNLYNWKNQADCLIYQGYNWSGNGYWYQFSLVDDPDNIWCECLECDLQYIENWQDKTLLNLKF